MLIYLDIDRARLYVTNKETKRKQNKASPMKQMLMRYGSGTVNRNDQQQATTSHVRGGVARPTVLRPVRIIQRRPLHKMP